MTRQEVVELVDRVWSTWNIDQSMNARKGAYETWFRIIGDLDSADCAAALDQIIIDDRPWPPRPGTLRRLVIDRTSPAEIAPSPSEAWAQLRAVEAAANSGEGFTPVHPLVRATIEKLGVTSEHTLATNGDREMFMRVYEQVVAVHDARRYHLS